VQVPIVWVSAPIDAGFFLYEVPRAHWQAGHRLSELVLEDVNGKELARDHQIARSFGEVATGAFVPPPTARGAAH
jgi:hypothetical protein